MHKIFTGVPHMNQRIDRFEDLIAWQKARVLSRRIYQVTRSGEFSSDFGLKDQIRRASISVMSNLAEGFERGKVTEFHQYICIAKGSCAELRCQLYAAKDSGYLDDDVFRDLMNKAREVGRILGGLRKAVDRKRQKRS